MYPEFTAHPLRKDYPVARREPLVPERDPIAAPWPPRGAA
jgi:NADH:ubiquinone oxidoreductase subunit C